MTFNHGVPGSNPGELTNNFKDLAEIGIGLGSGIGIGLKNISPHITRHHCRSLGDYVWVTSTSACSPLFGFSASRSQT